MKNLLKIVAVAGLAFTMASCGTVNNPYGNNYPNNGTVYRTPDGTVYGRGDVYRDRNGNVYQNGRIIRTGDIYGQPGILGRNRNLPPGQAKKIYGGNARDYAPGQVKKRQRFHNNGPVIHNQNNRQFQDNGDSKENKKLKKRNGKRNGK